MGSSEKNNGILSVPEDVERIMKVLSGGGFEAFAVGGCVRDMLLGREPYDYDVATSARPEKTRELLEESGVRVADTGIQHGTVTALTDRGFVDITTYRVDGEYTDSRHPDTVVFTDDLREDMARRDFTINAMAMRDDRIEDWFGGREDLRKGLIRAVGNPEKRFREDGLRIMRGLRFASVYGFQIEEETSDSMIRCGGLLKNISAERIFTELKKLLCGPSAGEVLRKYKEVFFQVIPELRKCDGFDQRSSYHLYDVFEHLVRAVENIDPDPVLRTAALLHDIGKPNKFSLGDDGEGHFYGHGEESERIGGEILERLRADGAFKFSVILLVKNHHRRIDDSDKAVRKALYKLEEKPFFDLIKLKRADGAATGRPLPEEGEHWSRVKIRAKRIIGENQCISRSRLAVNGRDLMEAGVPQGRIMGKILGDLLEEVLEGKLENEKAELVKEAVRLYNTYG